MKIKVILSIAALFCVLNLSATTWHVKPSGNDSNSGANWEQAFKNLQVAIDAAVAGDQIWVAAGTYAPTSAIGNSWDPAWKTFKITKDVKIYGGFTGTESNLSDRDWEANETILSGVQDEVLHVVYTTGVSNACLVDGFTITGGNARLSGGVTTSLNSSGGGWYNDAYATTSSPSIFHCTFTGNYAISGGGAFLNNGVGGTSHVIFSGCTFSGNGADSGGAIYSEGTNELTDITDCVFTGNLAYSNGGAINDNATRGSGVMNITSCDFLNNNASEDGGAIYVINVSGHNYLNVSACNFQGNKVTSFGAAIHAFSRLGEVHTQVVNSVLCGNYSQLEAYLIFNQQMDGVAKFDLMHCTMVGNHCRIVKSLGDTTRFTNCIIFNNSAQYSFGDQNTSIVTYCNVQATYGVHGLGNYSFEPSFVYAPSADLAPTSDGDYHLTPCSRDINWGNNEHAPATDMDGNPRPTSAQVDVGAYEKGMTAGCKNATVYLDANGNATFPVNRVNDNTVGCDPIKFKVNGQETINFSCNDVGANHFTVAISDKRANTATCETTIQVLDTIPPVIVCPPNQTIFADADCRKRIDTWNPEASSDNCSTTLNGLIQLPYHDTWLQGDGASVTVQLSIRDEYLNKGYCNFTITLKDNTAPAVSCRNISVNLNASGTANITTDQVFQSGSDNCGAVNQVSVLPNAFTCSDIGQNTVVLTVDDGHNNASSCSATVTVADNTAPTVICKPYTANLDANGTASLSPAQVFQSGADNCGVVNQQSVFPNTFSCSDLGARTVTLMVNDGHGNTSTCNATVTVKDNIAPTVVCQNKTIFLNAAGSASITTADVFLSGTDNCGAVNQQSVAPNAFTCSDWGAKTVTFTANDGHGNTNTCTATVTVADNIAPTVVCQNKTVYLNAAGSAAITTADVFQSGADNCGAVNQQSVAPNTFNCSQTGANTVALTVNDGHGNNGTCTAVVTVKDAIAPTMLCKNVSLNLDASGQATLTVAQVNNGSYDNCSIVTLELDKTSFTCANVGANTVTLAGTDPSNNKNLCTAIITVSDPIVPVAKCKNVTANLGANGSVTIPGDAVNNGSTDNCFFSLSLTPGTFQCNNIGLNTVTLKATDAGGNTATCTAKVTIKDANAPSALCKNSIVYLNNQGQGTLSPAEVDNGSSDNCGITTSTLSKTQYNCSEIQGSPWNVTLTLKDASNNTSSCSAQVTVKDAIAPTAICENATVSLGSNGRVTVYAANLAAGSVDNCSVWSYSPAAKVYNSANLGQNNLVITVKDWSGNAANCTSVVTVLPYSGGNFDGQDNRNSEAKDADAVPTLVLYPNPTTGDANLRFQLSEPQEYRVRVFDLSGRMVFQYQKQGVEGENDLPIHLQGMAAGVYLVEFRAGSVCNTQRLVVVE